MKRCVIGFTLLLLGACVGMMLSPMLSAQPSPKGYSTTMIERTDLQNIPGQEVLVFTSEWAPGSALPMHSHPNGHEFVYVVEGEQTFHFQGGSVKTVKAGEVLYTPPNTPHFGENATNRVSRVIVFRIKDKAAPISVEVNK